MHSGLRAGQRGACFLRLPGVPIPPRLELAKPVTDLRAARKGDRVYLAWTVPAKTTDRQTVRHPGVTRICRSLEVPVADCKNPAAEIPASPVSVAHRQFNPQRRACLRKLKPATPMSCSSELQNKSHRRDHICGIGPERKRTQRRTLQPGAGPVRADAAAA